MKQTQRAKGYRNEKMEWIGAAEVTEKNIPGGLDSGFVRGMTRVGDGTVGREGRRYPRVAKKKAASLNSNRDAGKGRASAPPIWSREGSSTAVGTGQSLRSEITANHGHQRPFTRCTS